MAFLGLKYYDYSFPLFVWFNMPRFLSLNISPQKIYINIDFYLAIKIKKMLMVMNLAMHVMQI